MRPDPGRDIQEARIAALSTAQRVAAGSDLRRRGLLIVWQNIDEARIVDPVRQADFVIRRLYPEMPDAWFESVVAKLAALHAAGRWHGFRRPE